MLEKICMKPDHPVTYFGEVKLKICFTEDHSKRVLIKSWFVGFFLSWKLSCKIHTPRKLSSLLQAQQVAPASAERTVGRRSHHGRQQAKAVAVKAR